MLSNLAEFEKVLEEFSKIVEKYGYAVVKTVEKAETLQPFIKNDVEIQSSPNSKISYVIDYTNRVITAQMVDVEYEITTEIANKNLPLENGKKYLLKQRYTGKAKCSPEDLFDVEYGKNLARARMLTKFYADKQKLVLEYYENVLLNKINFLAKLYSTAEGRCEKFACEVKRFEF